MNRYGAMAQSHWKTWLPTRYAALEDPTSFFTELGIQVSDRIASLELDLLDREVPGEPFLTRVGRRNMARLQAEEIVLAELVLLTPEPSLEPSEDTDELPTRWRIPSAAETVATVAAAEPSPPGGAPR